jgi:outer membrane receptor protein involved in Fe transport
MRVKSITYIFFILSFISFAQDLTISGKVIDVNNIPIAYTNIVVLMDSDSSFVNGTTTNEEGFFKIEKLKATNYILKITYLGFKDYTKQISLNSNTNFASITLEESTQELDGVLVVAKKPTVKRLVDRLVFNVENSTLSNSNLLDVLKHAPGVIIFNDELFTSGGEPIIYINDKKVHLSSKEVLQLLEGTSASNIKSIEVITNPPAKYEAEGAAVINIVTGKNIIAGYNGSVFGDFKQGFEYPKYSIGTSHFFKTKKLDAYVNYSISPKKNFRHIDESINFIDTNNQISSSWETDFDRTQKSSDQNTNANLEYTINDNNSIGLSSNMLISPRENTKAGINSLTEVYSANKVLDSLFNTVNNSVEEVFNIALTLDYVHKFKREGEKLMANVHHTNYDYSIFQDVNTGYFFPNSNVSFRDNKFQTFSSQQIKIVTGQLDYVLPIDESSQLELGIKFSDINSSNKITQYSFENGVRVEDLQNSDTFLYSETNYASYVSYSKDWDNWSLKSGFRMENSDITGNSLSTNSINDSDYNNFFPSFYLLHILNENNELYFRYNKRIYRPRYNQLNPFKFFLSDNTFNTGDPNLKPQIDDSFTLGYTLKKDFTFEIYYRNEKNPAIQIMFQDNENNFLQYVETNINSSISYGLDFTTYTKIANRWDFYASSSLFYYENKFNALQSNNELYSTDKWTLYLVASNYFTFLKDKSLIADVSYMYISPFVQGPVIVSDRSGLDISLRKTLWNNKASLSMGITDVFNTKNFSTSTKYLNQDALKQRTDENRLFTVGFNYKFGNFRLNNNKKEVDLDERKRLSSAD